MFHDLTLQIGLIILAVITLVVIFRGEIALRIATAALVLNVISCELAEDWNGHHKAQPVILEIDIAYSVLLLIVVFRTKTRWPQVAAVAQILIVATHLGALVGPQVTRWDFFTLYYALSYAVLAALLYGALAEAPVKRLAPPKTP